MNSDYCSPKGITKGEGITEGDIMLYLKNRMSPLIFPGTHPRSATPLRILESKNSVVLKMAAINCMRLSPGGTAECSHGREPVVHDKEASEVPQGRQE